ncbi:MAG: NTP transferase domain-containing protein [Microbacteriaceae bacterium]
MRVVGVVLAAGAGTRYGGPKGLARDADGTPWVALAVRMLRDAGCDDVLVAVGASGDEVAALVPPAATPVAVDEWSLGIGRTLRAALGAASALSPDVVVVTPVDTPTASAAAVERVLAAGALARAVYRGAPGHPVAIPSAHLGPLIAALPGDDHGAAAYLAAHGAVEVECADLWSGADIDTPVEPD